MLISLEVIIININSHNPSQDIRNDVIEKEEDEKGTSSHSSSLFDTLCIQDYIMEGRKQAGDIDSNNGMLNNSSENNSWESIDNFNYKVTSNRRMPDIKALKKAETSRNSSLINIFPKK